jgi:6,7-dimethyl-8-ribityllumazine synthase
VSIGSRFSAPAGRIGPAAYGFRNRSPVRPGSGKARKDATMNQSPMEATQSEARFEAGRIAFVQSCWHRDIVDQAWHAFQEEMGKAGLHPRAIERFELPGAFEIPLQAKLLAKTRRYQAIVAAGFVVDGGIYRHEFVADAVIAGLMQVQLETEVPVLSCVLTPQRFHEHAEHQTFFRDHFQVKGREVALACLATMRNVGALRTAA